ncbi:hypothetical protein [uncultured Microbulbifer sp.]|uniref:hypothetical protein n=1 Tax=uncultured Microbulbifer sp. TaxID=348147 RepID=UPI00262AD28B|nr:hypothetical protein [uncultured Microbulbifer sp.]
MAVNYRFGMFMALREYADVIALDQRVIGHSNNQPTCESEQIVPPLTQIFDAHNIDYHHNALEECLSFGRSKEILLVIRLWRTPVAKPLHIEWAVYSILPASGKFATHEMLFRQTQLPRNKIQCGSPVKFR